MRRPPTGTVLVVVPLLLSLSSVVPAYASPQAASHDTRESGDPFVWVDDAAPEGTPLTERPSRRVAERSDVDVLALHSLPGSAHTIFLDFNGMTITGTAWNDQGVTAGYSPGWDPAGNGTDDLTADEQDGILEVWTRVAEDFAPFDVDVTTAEPTNGAITRNGPADQVFGTRVLISPDNQARSAIDGCAGGCGGVSYNDVVDLPTDHATYQPSWVFPQGLGPDDPKFIAEAASHEVGHAFGLDHDDRAGDGQNGYYSGHEPWAPIMGAGYQQPITQWSHGDFAGSTNSQDDLAIIAGNGAPLRADESTTLPLTGVPAFITGADDVDVYRLGDCAGALHVDADVAEQGADLDVELALLDATQSTTLATADPDAAAVSSHTATGLSASIAVPLPASPADYYLSVRGTGLDGTTPTTGYDAYGSVGAYRLTVSGCGVAGGTPGLPGVPGLVFSGTTAKLAWSAPSDSGDSPITGYRITVDGVQRTAVSATNVAIGGLERGETYRFGVAAVNAQGVGLTVFRKGTVPSIKPGAPRIGKPTSGSPGGQVSIKAAWKPPLDDGGADVTKYRLKAFLLNSNGKVVRTYSTNPFSAGFTSIEVQLPVKGRYRLAVAALNKIGWGRYSAKSSIAVAR